MIKIVFLTKVGCGICTLMHGTTQRLRMIKPEWNVDHFHITNNQEATFYNAHFGVENVPAWLIFDGSKYLGRVEGGHRISTLVNKISSIVEHRRNL